MYTSPSFDMVPRVFENILSSGSKRNENVALSVVFDEATDTDREDHAELRPSVQNGTPTDRSIEKGPRQFRDIIRARERYQGSFPSHVKIHAVSFSCSTIVSVKK